MTPDTQKDLEDVVREAKQIQDTLARVEEYSPQALLIGNASKEGIRVDMKIKSGSSHYLMTITDQDLVSCFNLMMQGLVNENIARLKKRYELL